MDAKSMLFIDNGHHQVSHFDAFLEQGVGPDGKIDFARGQTVEYSLPCLSLLAAGENGAGQANLGRERLDRCQMLAGQYLGWGHQCGLSAGFHGLQHCQQGDDCFAAANVSLEQSQHGTRR